MQTKVTSECSFNKKLCSSAKMSLRRNRKTPVFLWDTGGDALIGKESITELQNQIILEKALRDISELAWKISPDAELYGRVKSIQSTFSKMHAHGFGIERVLDAVGVRVILTHTEECYRLVEQIHQKFTFIQSEYNNYIQNPKPNGYRSLHTTILASNGHPIEIQIRTHWMHALAEQGRAAHWLYKQDKD